MLIRNKLEPRKGAVQDLPRQIAEAMIADGRAELAFPDQYPALSVPTPNIAATVAAPKPARKRR